MGKSFLLLSLSPRPSHRYDMVTHNVLHLPAFWLTKGLLDAVGGHAAEKRNDDLNSQKDVP